MIKLCTYLYGVFHCMFLLCHARVRPKTFCRFFEHFKEKNQPHALQISEIIDFEKRGYLNI